MGTIEAIIRVKIRPGQLDGFKAQAAEILRLVREKDPGTLRNDWFIDEAALQCEVHELYADEEALIAHGMNIMPAREVLFRDYAYDHRLTVYGEAPQRFVEMLTKRGGQVGVYSFLQGLEQHAVV